MNITKTTEEFVDEHPSIRVCLKKDILNLSSLARLIIEKKNLSADDFHAIVAAARRYERRIKQGRHEKDIKELFSNSKIKVKTKIIGVVLDKDISQNNLTQVERNIKQKKEEYQMIKGEDAITLITSSESEKVIKRIFNTKIIRVDRNLAEIIIKSPPEIGQTPGSAAHIYSLLGDRGINIIETMSCHTDTLLLIEENDLSKTLEIIRF